MPEMQLLAVLVALAPVLLSSASPAESSVTVLSSDRSALAAAEHDLCGWQVALLGEGPTHGDGHTEAFKVALVERLVDHCHYSAIAFESGGCEFIALNRAFRSRTATVTMLSDAVGAVWSYHREFQPLASFLFAQAKAGRMRLAGLDCQIGGLGETFTNE